MALRVRANRSCSCAGQRASTDALNERRDCTEELARLKLCVEEARLAREVRNSYDEVNRLRNDLSLSF